MLYLISLFLSVLLTDTHSFTLHGTTKPSLSFAHYLLSFVRPLPVFRSTSSTTVVVCICMCLEYPLTILLSPSLIDYSISLFFCLQVTIINYRGCMDFKYPQLWQNLDNMNALAGVTTHLATAASDQLTTFQPVSYTHLTLPTKRIV